MTYYEKKPQLFVYKHLQISYTEKNGGAAMKYSWIEQSFCKSLALPKTYRQSGAG